MFTDKYSIDNIISTQDNIRQNNISKIIHFMIKVLLSALLSLYTFNYFDNLDKSKQELIDERPLFYYNKITNNIFPSIYLVIFLILINNLDNFIIYYIWVIVCSF
jgi:hypothetical protein